MHSLHIYSAVTLLVIANHASEIAGLFNIDGQCQVKLVNLIILMYVFSSPAQARRLRQQSLASSSDQIRSCCTHRRLWTTGQNTESNISMFAAPGILS